MSDGSLCKPYAIVKDLTIAAKNASAKLRLAAAKNAAAELRLGANFRGLIRRVAAEREFAKGRADMPDIESHGVIIARAARAGLNGRGRGFGGTNPILGQIR